MKLRWIASEIENWRSSTRKPVLVLTGARQVGKTTIARSLVSSGFEILPLDDPILRGELARTDSAAFARRYPMAILDEVQKSPQLVEIVKAIVDRGGEERYLLLGSSHVLLLERVRESLVGRTQLRHLNPLGLGEMVSDGPLSESPPSAPALVELLSEITDGPTPTTLENLPPNLALHPLGNRLTLARERWLRLGGMPALWPSPLGGDEEVSLSDADIRDELQTYVTLYLERDLGDLARLRDLEPFVRLQRLAAERTARVVALSDLARDAGLSTTTVKNYLRYLELSFQVRTIPPFSSNPTKRLVKSSKLCWTDIGIWRAVTRRWADLPGELYESAVISEIAKVVDAFRLPWELYHLRTYDQREVDLLLVTENRAVAIEIKSSEQVHPKDARHLKNLTEVVGRPCDLGLVIYRGREIRRLGSGLWAVPDVMLLGPSN